tara:strand:- start:6 stop:1337 length:1332 start_codon:yes stop_codon:yes gene_type:complete
MKIQKIDITPEKILNLLRGNFVLIIIAGIIAFLLDYRNVFKGPDEFYYNILSGLVSLLILIIIKKYWYPFYYSPNHIFFVKDRSDPMVRLEPLLDPIITTLGLIRYGDFVNIRYRLYPDLPTGVDLNPNTGLISGFPMEVGNHTSEVKMRFLGGEYSTNIRIEVVNTLKEKMVVPERDEFAPPRTVAQLLLREEDVLKREQDLEYSLAQEREAFEREYHIKELSLKSNFDSEKDKLKKELADSKRAYKDQLEQKNVEISNISSDMKDKLEKLDQENTNKIEELNQERSNQVGKLESEMITALQDKEREFIDFEKDIKSKFETKERELEENYKVEEVVEEESVEEGPEEEVVDEEPVEEEPEEEVVEEEEPEEEVVVEEEPVEEEPVEEEPVEEVVVEEPEEEEYDYVSMTKAELVELAKKRNLSTSGNKKTIISRLEKSINDT